MLNFQLPGCPILCFYRHVSYNSAVWGPSGQPSLQTAHGTFLSPWKVLLCPFPANPSKPSLLAFFLLAFFGWEGAEGPRAPAAWGAYSLPLPVVWGLRQGGGQWAQLGWVHLGFGPIRPVHSGHQCRRNPAGGSSCTCRVASPHLPSVQGRAAHVGQGFSLSGIYFI